MKLKKLTFRDIDKKWIAINNKKDIKKICKSLKLKYDSSLMLGYFYIDHENGIMIKIVGNVIHEYDSYFIDEELLYKNTSISIDEDTDFDFTFIDDNVVNNIKYSDIITNQFSNLYQKKSIIESRKIADIDEFRHAIYIDDVELSLTTGKKCEHLWARIEDCDPVNLVFVCSLLDKSKHNKKYQENVLVLAKIVREKKKNSFVINGIVNKVEK